MCFRLLECRDHVVAQRHTRRRCNNESKTYRFTPLVSICRFQALSWTRCVLNNLASRSSCSPSPSLCHTQQDNNSHRMPSVSLLCLDLDRRQRRVGSVPDARYACADAPEHTRRSCRATMAPTWLKSYALEFGRKGVLRRAALTNCTRWPWVHDCGAGGPLNRQDWLKLPTHLQVHHQPPRSFLVELRAVPGAQGFQKRVLMTG